MGQELSWGDDRNTFEGVKDQQVVSYQRYIKTERERILREVQDLLVTGGD